MSMEQPIVNTPPEIYQIKITLLGTDPPIWRRLQVPANLTPTQLHNVLQTAMGWGNSHLHEFRIGKRRFGQPGPADPFMRAPSVESERTARLSVTIEKVSSKIIYTYDFGDNWEHSIVLEELLPADPNARYPICIDGKLACPPEDCGGVPGYYDLLEALADSNHERHEELRDWLGGDFDPEAFFINKVNRLLSRGRGRKNRSR